MCGRVIHKINFQTLWQLGSSMSMTEWNIMRAAMTGQTGVMQDIDFPSTYKWSNCVIIRINNDQEMSWYHLLSPANDATNESNHEEREIIWSNVKN